MNKSVRFVAETDEFGRVLWLWRLKPGERLARPVQDLMSIDLELRTCATEGAPLESVLTWLTQEKLKAERLLPAPNRSDLISNWPSRGDIAI